MNRMGRALLLVLGFAALTGAASPVSAQVRHLAGGYIMGSFPTGDWGKIAGFGTALDGTDIVRTGPEKPLAWRLSTGLLYNFSRTVDVPQANLLPTSKLEIETKNWSLLFGLGPELAMRGGDIMPFVYGTAGFDTYWTSSELSGTAGALPYSAQHGDSRISFAWAAGGGIRRHVSSGLMGEVSLEYRSGVSHHFLLPDDVSESVTGGVNAKRDNHSSDQFLLRLGTVVSN